MMINKTSSILSMVSAIVLMVAVSAAHPVQDQTQPFGNQGQTQPFGNQDPTQPFGPGDLDPGTIPVPEDPVTNLDPPPSVRQGSFEEAGQEVSVRKEFSGWQAANDGNNGQPLTNDLRSNWVMTEKNGEIGGTVYGIENADTRGMIVYLLNQGRLVTQAVTDDGGNFQFNNVVEGSYSLVGFGDNAFFTFGVNILAHRDNARAFISRRFDVTAFQNSTTINLDWIRFFAPTIKFRVFGVYEEGEGEEDPAEFYGLAGLGEFQPAAAPATSINSHDVFTTADGRLIGRVHQLDSLDGRPVDIRQTRILLLKGDEVMAATTTDNFGVFEISGVPADTYALVAAGQDGLGCIGISVVSGSSMPDGEDDDDELPGPPVDFSSANVFDFTLASAETVGWINSVSTELAYERIVTSPRPQQPPTDQFGFAQGQGNGTCPQCNNAGGGCNHCGNQGIGGQPGRGQGRTNAQNVGRFIRDANRRFNDRLDRLFFPDDGQIPNVQGFNNQGFNNQGFNNQGFNNQGFGPTPVNQNFGGAFSPTPAGGGGSGFTDGIFRGGPTPVGAGPQTGAFPASPTPLGSNSGFAQPGIVQPGQGIYTPGSIQSGPTTGLQSQQPQPVNILRRGAMNPNSVFPRTIHR